MIGQIVKPQGVRGELKVIPYTDDMTRFSLLRTVYLEDKKTPHAVKGVRYGQDCLFLTLEEVRDRNEAEKLRDCFLYVARKDAVPLPEGSYYIADLIGMTVKDDAGRVLGTLDDVYQAGGNDVYPVVRDKNFLVPAVKKVLLSVDPENSLMVLDRKALSEVAVFED